MLLEDPFEETDVQQARVQRAYAGIATPPTDGVVSSAEELDLSNAPWGSCRSSRGRGARQLQKQTKPTPVARKERSEGNHSSPAVSTARLQCYSISPADQW